VNGTESNKVYFTSIKDDEVGGDTNEDGDATAPTPEDWRRIAILDDSTSYITSAVIRYGNSDTFGALVNRGHLTLTDTVVTRNGVSGFFQQMGATTIAGGEFSYHSSFGIHTGVVGTISVTGASIHHNSNLGIYNESSNVINATNNYWGDPSGPAYSLNPEGLGDGVSNNVLFSPWLSAKPAENKYVGCVGECFSNVLFLPGMMASLPTFYIAKSKGISPQA
jgi:hypothetical protein